MVVGPKKGFPRHTLLHVPTAAVRSAFSRRRAELCHGGEAKSLQSLLGHVPGLGTSCVPSEGGMVKPDSQIGEFAP